jgi:hypothetical protein
MADIKRRREGAQTFGRSQGADRPILPTGGLPGRRVSVVAVLRSVEFSTQPHALTADDEPPTIPTAVVFPLSVEGRIRVQRIRIRPIHEPPHSAYPAHRP